MIKQKMLQNALPLNASTEKCGFVIKINNT